MTRLAAALSSFRAARLYSLRRSSTLPSSATEANFLICVLIALFAARSSNRRFSFLRRLFLAFLVCGIGPPRGPPDNQYGSRTITIRTLAAESTCGTDWQFVLRSVLPRHVCLLQAVLPLVEQPADLPVGEIEVGQFVAHVDRVGEVAGVRRSLGQLEQDFLAGLVLAWRDALQGFFKVA